MPKKRIGCQRKPRRSIKPASNIGIKLTTNVNTEVKKLFVAVATAGLFTSLAPISVADLGYDTPRGMVFDAKGNLLVANAEAGNIMKFTPDGHCSTFASGLVHPFGLAFDGGALSLLRTCKATGKAVSF